MKRIFTLASCLMLALGLLSACGKKSTPVLEGADGKAIPGYTYPAPYEP